MAASKHWSIFVKERISHAFHFLAISQMVQYLLTHWSIDSSFKILLAPQSFLRSTSACASFYNLNLQTSLTKILISFDYVTLCQAMAMHPSCVRVSSQLSILAARFVDECTICTANSFEQIAGNFEAAAKQRIAFGALLLQSFCADELKDQVRISNFAWIKYLHGLIQAGLPVAMSFAGFWK
jgi:hypothetical protein